MLNGLSIKIFFEKKEEEKNDKCQSMKTDAWLGSPGCVSVLFFAKENYNIRHFNKYLENSAPGKCQ